MTKSVIYEVNLELDAEVAAEFDSWLDTHIDEMLRLSGFESAQIYRDDGAEEAAAVKRTVQYRVRSNADLEEYLDHRADAMQAEGEKRFSGRFTAKRRVLKPRGPAPTGDAAILCQNCGNALAGQYCSHCGQRAKIRVITLWELAKDVVGDVFELDSRLWRTLRPLLFKPGLLTREYLAGRRVHYVPPFRMYLVLSLVFFLITTMGGGFEITTDGEETVQDIETGLEGLAELEETLQESGIDGLAELEEAFAEELRAGDTPAGEPADGDQDLEDVCNQIGEQIPIERVQRNCVRIRDNPGAFGKALVDNVPTMLFFFLPLIALVMKLLFLGSGRYYVEHLLFFVHYHSFFFLILILNILLWRLTDLLPISSVVPGLVTTAVVIYIPVYLFLAMRVVYEHGTLAGILRYTLLLVAYFVCLLLTFLATLAFTALTL